MRPSLPQLLSILILACLASASWAETQVYRATYKGKFAGLTIETERRLTRLDDGTYQLTSDASNFLGSINETSHFSVEADQWRPLEYTYSRRIFGAKAKETIAFDWETMTAAYTHSDKPERNAQHKLEPGMLDPALYLLQVQRDLIRGQTVLEYRFVKRDRIRHYRVERLASETLSINKQSYDAIKVGRADPDDDKQTFVWAIPSLSYVFGKISHTEDGDEHEMVLTSYSVDKAQLAAVMMTTANAPITAEPNSPR